MMACVAAVVRVTAQAICGVVDTLGQEGERHRRVVAGLLLKAVPIDR